MRSSIRQLHQQAFHPICEKVVALKHFRDSKIWIEGRLQSLLEGIVGIFSQLIKRIKKGEPKPSRLLLYDHFRIFLSMKLLPANMGLYITSALFYRNTRFFKLISHGWVILCQFLY